MDFNLYNLFKQISNWVAPSSCRLCSQPLDRKLNDKSQDEGLYLAHHCCECYLKLPHQVFCCDRCRETFSGFSDYCGKCLNTPPNFDSCFCPFQYEAPISDDICKLKYADQPQIAKYLANLFLNELYSHGKTLPDALISVPMHASKLRKRGFNQSHELAKHISKSLKLPIIEGVLVKSRNTERQVTKTLKQRKKNLKGSFDLLDAVKTKHIAIIDDVVTTGATADEIAKILKRNGVDYIQVWGIARTR